MGTHGGHASLIGGFLSATDIGSPCQSSACSTAGITKRTRLDVYGNVTLKDVRVVIIATHVLLGCLTPFQKYSDLGKPVKQFVFCFDQIQAVPCWLEIKRSKTSLKCSVYETQISLVILCANPGKCSTP